MCLRCQDGLYEALGTEFAAIAAKTVARDEERGAPGDDPQAPLRAGPNPSPARPSPDPLPGQLTLYGALDEHNTHNSRRESA